MSETPISDALMGILDMLREHNEIIRTLSMQQTGIAAALAMAIKALPDGPDKDVAQKMIAGTMQQTYDTLKAAEDEQT